MDTPDDTPPTEYQHPASDWLLSMMVSSANAHNLEMNVTLQMHGMLVSGMLVSNEAYRRGVAETFRQASGDTELAAAMADGMEQEAKPIEQTPDGPPPVFIHLRDAKFCDAAGNSFPSGSGAWWRGRLVAVDGFVFGTTRRQIA